ncbi:MAG: hypothetical protein ACE5FD_10920 [Anaerolineae bacterium]
MPENREVTEGLQYQGEDEKIAYTISTTPWGSSPTSISAVVKDVSNAATDVTGTVMPTGSPSAAGDVITLPLLQALTAAHLYRVEVKFTCSGNTFEAWFYVQGET